MASTCITRDPMSGGYTSKITISCWIKICDPNLSNNGGIFMIRKGNSYTASRLRVYLESGSNKLVWELKDSGGSDDSFIKSNARLRDVGAWYHICMSYDSTLSTAADRLKMWINGKDVRTEYGGFQSDDQAGSGFQVLCSSAMFVGLGRIDENNGADYKFNGSMAECYFIYDSTYDVSTFGETDTTTGEWKPKLDIASGITFGSQGFYFPFTNAANMKADSSGNSNTYSITGTLTQTQDCPSNVFATLNPLHIQGNTNRTIEYGNTRFYTGSTSWGSALSTLGFSSGKFYVEAKILTLNSSTGYGAIAIQDINAFGSSGNTNANLGENASSAGLTTDYRAGQSAIRSGGSTVSSNVGTFSNNDIIGMAIDMDNKALYIHKNGTYYQIGGVTGVPTSGASKTGAVTIPTSIETCAIGLGSYTSAADSCYNFGNGYFLSTAVSSAGTNASGNGIFEYDVPAGYTALSTKGLNK